MGLGCVSPAGTVPMRLRRSPVFRRKTKHDSLPEPEEEPTLSSDAAGETRCFLFLHSPAIEGVGAQRVPSHTHPCTPALPRCHAAGLPPRWAGRAAGWSRHRQQAATSPVTNCCECTRLSSRRPKMPGARPGGASPGTVKPLHAAALFPIKPCKQVCGARVIGSPGAGSRAGAQACSVLRHRLTMPSVTSGCRDGWATSVAQEGWDA